MPEQLASISWVQVENVIKIITWPGVSFFFAFVLWRSGILSALASRVMRNGSSSHARRIDELESFKHVQESNHNTDIEELKAWRVRTDTKMDKMAEDIGYLRGRINSNH